MTKPVHYLCHAGHKVSGRHLGPVDQDDRQAKVSRGNQLCFRPGPTRILCNDMADVMGMQKGDVAINRERTCVDDSRGMVKRQSGFWRIDKTQEIMVHGLGDKGAKRLLADGQKDPCAAIRQRGNSSGDIGHMGPSVARLRAPFGPFQTQKQHTCRGAGRDSVATHPCGKGMGCIHHMADPVFCQVKRKPRDPAKAPCPGRQGLRPGRFRATGIGKHRLQPSLRNCTGKVACFGGAAKDQDARHG